MKKTLVFFFLMVFLISYSQECDECIKKVTSDPKNPLHKYKRLTEKYQLQSYAHASIWMLFKTSLKYCGYCTSAAEKEDMLKTIYNAETDLKNLRSNGPVFASSSNSPEVTLSGLKAEFEAYHYAGATHDLTSTDTDGITNNDSDANEEQKNSPGDLNNKSTSNSAQALKVEYEKLRLKNKEEAKSIAENAKNISVVSSGKTKKTVDDDELFKSEDEDNVSMKGDPNVVERKHQAIDSKLNRYNQFTSKIASKEGKSCSAKGQLVDFSRVAFTKFLSKHSLDGSQPWSDWVAVPGTALQVRYSAKKVCEEPEFPKTTDIHDNLKYISEGIDQFFDYGFIQFKNSSDLIVSGRVTLTIKGDNTTRTENWPFYLDPNEQGEESLGNWYSGCSILTLKIEEYCTTTKKE